MQQLGFTPLFYNLFVLCTTPYFHPQTTPELRSILDENGVHNALPRRHGRELGTVSVDLIPRQLTASRVDVNLLRLEPTLALPQVADDPEQDDDGEGKHGAEEALGVAEGGLLAGLGGRGDGGKDL